MPYKRKFKKNYKKKNYRRRYRKGGKGRAGQTKIVRGAGKGIPDRLFNCLKYAERLQANPAGFTYSYLFNMNSVFDPNRTGTGHQPMYYDQLATLYNRYRVRAFAYTVVVSNVNTPITCTIVPVNGTSTPASATDASENPLAVQKIVNTMTSGGGSIQTFKGYVRLSTLLGEMITDDRDQAVVGSSPSNGVVLSIQLDTLDGSTNITSLNIYVKFKYYTEWFDRNTVVGS